MTKTDLQTNQIIRVNWKLLKNTSTSKKAPGASNVTNNVGWTCKEQIFHVIYRESQQQTYNERKKPEVLFIKTI